MRKSGKPCPIKVYRQRLIRSAKGIDTHVKFSASKEQRIKKISLGYVRLRWIIAIEGFPFGYISYFAKNENAFSLAFGGLTIEKVTGFMIHKALLSLCVRLNY